jgi:hypothetical protein
VAHAPVHAVWLLTDLRAESTIESMLDVLAETEWETTFTTRSFRRCPDSVRPSTSRRFARMRTADTG